MRDESGFRVQSREYRVLLSTADLQTTYGGRGPDDGELFKHNE